MNSYLWSQDVWYFHQFVIDKHSSMFRSVEVDMIEMIEVNDISVWRRLVYQSFALTTILLCWNLEFFHIEQNQSSDDGKISAEHAVSFPSKSIDFGPKTMCHVAGKLVRREILASANYSKSIR